MTSALATSTISFPDLLRTWRKTRKLSQWDLSLNAGISQRHLSFLESGRSSPSREMVLKLASSLEIPLQEQNSLLGSAGFAPIFQAAALDDASLQEARKALEIMLSHHEPYPCLVANRNWDMIMTNAANIKLFSQYVDPFDVWEKIDDPGTQNLARLALHPNGLKPHIKNWSTFANYFVQALRQELQHNPYATQTRELLDDLMQLPDMPNLVEIAPTTTRPFLVMELLSEKCAVSLFSVVSSFGSPHDATLQQLRIETFFPADPASEKVIRKLAETA